MKSDASGTIGSLGSEESFSGPLDDFSSSHPGVWHKHTPALNQHIRSLSTIKSTTFHHRKPRKTAKPPTALRFHDAKRASHMAVSVRDMSKRVIMEQSECPTHSSSLFFCPVVLDGAL
ncbi:hypothetical protein QQF64_012897 [Cirrhinus molitorella]|uniref:Uncharacterized protein n=1 Tax=Cirrhinus molitorella TaxID=172907 RepID=A0ABR3LRY5_9TELE